MTPARGDRPARRLPDPSLMLVTDRRLAGGEDALLRAVDEAIAGGVNIVQLREKDLPHEELAALARRLREVTQGRALLIVNSAADVAEECGADGVHLPEDAQMVRSSLLVGRSVHSVDAAKRAEAEGADYVIAGPVYKTRSHPGRAPLGVDEIGKICEVVRLPVIAIGGIDYQRAAAVVCAGARGIAVISAIISAPSPRGAASGLREAIAAASRETNAAP